MDHIPKDLVSILLQIITVHNAMVLGWKVKKIGHQTYELSKKKRNMNHIDSNTVALLKQVISFKLATSC